MMTFNKPFLPVTVLLLGITALLAGGKFPCLFFYLLILLFLVPFVWLRISLKKLTGDIEVATAYTEVGQYLTVTYRIRNSNSGRFPYLEMTDIIGSSFQSPAEKEIICLEAGESATFTREVLCTRRGKYDLGSFQVKTGDPFGFFQLAKPLATGEKIKVYPRFKLFPETTPSARQHFGNLLVKEKLFENYSQMSELREWQEGDSIKRIHWKQSARHDHIVVKNFEKKGDTTLNIFIDMRGKNYRHDRDHHLEDLAVETAASFIYFNLRNYVPVKIFSEPLSTLSLQGRQSRDTWEIMDSIITLAPSGKTNFSLFVTNRSYYLAPTSSLYLITPQLNIDDAAVFLRLKQKGFYLILFYLAQGELTPGETTILNKVRDAGIKTQTLCPMEAAKDVWRAL